MPRADRADVQRQQAVLDSFLVLRREYLVDGSFSSTSTLLSLLAYSKNIALTAGNSGSISWASDRQTIYYRGHPIVLNSFRRMVHDVLGRAEELLWQQLMWISTTQQRFLISLMSVVDDVTRLGRGYSFL